MNDHGRVDIYSPFAPVFQGVLTDSDLETMERLQIGVGPRPKSPLLLRDQKQKAPLWDYLMN